MKRLLKILVPVFIISLAFSLFFIPASAAKQESGYALWSSEEDFLANPSRPKAKVEAAKLDPQLLASGGFVFCYGDVEVSEAVGMNVGYHLVIDLNGHTLTATAKIQINNPSATSWRAPGSLVIRNGTIDHPKSQFIQARPNSEVYLENLVINAQKGGSNFITEAGSRIIHFKDCEINFISTASGTFLDTSPAFPAEKADQMYGKIDYVRNFVFENTVINDETPDGRLTVIGHRGDKHDILNVSFTGTSSFNTLRDSFLKQENTFDGTKITVNIAAGARFPTKEIPITARGFKVNYYDSIAVDGHLVHFGNKTELLGAGEEQPTEGPRKLEWGKSASTAYPYQLCTFFAKVTWVMENGDEVTDPESYAGGVILENDLSASIENPYSVAADGRITSKSHDGWSVSADRLNPSKTVTLAAKTNKFYAAFSERTLNVVEFTSSAMTLDTIVGGITGNEITSADFNSFREGAYVKFYADMVWTTDDTYTFDSTLTLDLGGKTFSKNLVASHGSGNFLVEGGALTVKGGKISSSLASFATVTGGTVTLDGVTLTFDAYPAFNVISGNVTLTNSAVEQRSADTDIPAFSISGADGANINIDTTRVAVNGPFAVLSAKDGVFGAANVTVNSCGDFTADSLITAYRYSADAFPAGAAVNVALDTVLLTSREVFDIGNKDNGAPALDVFASITDGCYFTAKPEVLAGELILPEGKTVLGFNEPGNSFRYKISTLELPSVMFNLTLEENFTANFYVPCESAITSASTYLGATAVSGLPVRAIDGVAYYVVAVTGINPTSILDTIEIKLSYRSAADGIEYTAELEYFITEYFDRLLSDRDPLMKKLAASAINYIASVYEYKDCELTEDFAALLADDRYLDALRPTDELPKAVSETDIGNLGVAFTGAQLYLSSDLYLRFNLRESFSGTVNLDGSYYTVTDGKVGNTSYVQIRLEAQDFYSEIVTVGGTSLDGTVISGSYSLIDYVNAHSAADQALRDFILAFFCYCYEANVYKNDGVVPPVNDHTPPLDVELR